MIHVLFIMLLSSSIMYLGLSLCIDCTASPFHDQSMLLTRDYPPASDSSCSHALFVDSRMSLSLDLCTCHFSRDCQAYELRPCLSHL